MEKYKIIEIDGRRFRLTKFNALDGSYITAKLAGILIPIVFANKDKKLEDINLTSSLMKIFDMEEKDFTRIQKSCLGCCFEILEGNEPRVLDDKGNFGVLDISDNTTLVMALTIHSLVFNLKSFFGGSLLGSLQEGILSSFQQS